MIYATVCSGIEAPTVAWSALGWHASFFAEIDPFCSALLAHYYPEVPNHGDFTTIDAPPAVDLLIAGTPCQSFSVAGARAGLDDPRGDLALEFLRLAARARARWVVWENVPGVLSSNGGQDFGAFLGALGELGYGFAYRVLDAQYFGVAQRRRRVFVVGHLGDWRPSAAVLFERACMSWDPAPGRGARQEVAGALRASSARRGASGEAEEGQLVVGTLGARSRRGGDEAAVGHVVVGHTAHALSAKAPHFEPTQEDYVIGFHATQDPIASTETSPSCARKSTLGVAAFDEMQITSSTNGSTVRDGAPSPTLAATSRMRAIDGATVRRLTPREWERLQGFPDDYTAIAYRGKPAADGPRYRALGNSMAIPVVRWIGERIATVDAIVKEAE